MNGFISPKSARVSNLLYINVWAIDVDYKKTEEFKLLKPEEMYERHIEPFVVHIIYHVLPTLKPEINCG